MTAAQFEDAEGRALVEAIHQRKNRNTMSSARDVLDGIKARLAAATPGPWKTEPVESGSFAHIESRVYSLRGSHILLSPTDGEAGQAKTPDAEFIAAAPADVARLTAAVEAVLLLASKWEARGEHDMAYSKTVQDEHIADFLLTDGATKVENARHIRNAIENALKD